MKMKDKTTKQEFHFHYDGWLVQRGAAEEGRDTLEMAAVRPDIPPPQGPRSTFRPKKINH